MHAINFLKTAVDGMLNPFPRAGGREGEEDGSKKIVLESFSFLVLKMSKNNKNLESETLVVFATNRQMREI